MPIIQYRKKQLPAIFTQIPYVRKSIAIIQGYPEDPQDIENAIALQRIASGEACVSELESPADFWIAISYPEEVAVNPQKNYLLDFYWLKFHDVCYWLNNQQAGGAVSYVEAGLDVKRIKALATKRSCLELFCKTELSKYSLSQEEEKSILKEEKYLFQEIDLQKIKNSYGFCGSGTSKPRISISTDVTQNKRILEWDKHKCIFQGTDRNCSGSENLEAGHIIPKAMVKRLHLDQKLIKADFNLTAMCFGCNRRISDFLSKKDVDFYLSSFADPAHRNHKILPYLKRIKDIQDEGC